MTEDLPYGISQDKNGLNIVHVQIYAARVESSNCSGSVLTGKMRRRALSVSVCSCTLFRPQILRAKMQQVSSIPQDDSKVQ